MDPLYVAIDGHIVINRHEPNEPVGSHVRFIPTDHAPLARLYRASRLGPSASDGALVVRLAGVEAPMRGYRNLSQPHAEAAADALHSWLGMTHGATQVPVTLLSDSIDPDGHPVAYVLRPRKGAPKAPKRCRLSAAIIRASANHALVESGHAYPRGEDFSRAKAREVIRDAARKARADALGVWATDLTVRGFSLDDIERVAVLPALFRKCADYLAATSSGSSTDSFTRWLARFASELVSIRHAANIPFASLVIETSDRIALATDITDLVYLEQES